MSAFWFLALLCLWLSGGLAQAKEVIPTVPSKYFNDYAQVVTPAVADALNRRLEQFERDTSNQILVAVYPTMDSDSSIEDYTVRVAQSWKVGQKAKNNGAVLFVFIQDRKMYLQVGYGLEAVLPDALAKQIIENELKPRFRTGDYAGGLTAGVDAILAATRGEYQGTGGTVAEGSPRRSQNPASYIPVLIFFGIFLFILVLKLRGAGSSRSGWGGWTMSGGGFSSGGWSGGSGGGGFSSGGGSFGGGGAGGSW
jgi:uncharacterized protein